MLTKSPETIEYDENDMPIRTQSSNNVKLSKKGASAASSDDDHDVTEEEGDPFKPKTGHRPGGLPMISDSAFSLTILIYVSVAFLLVFFLFCWKTNGNNGGNGGNGNEGLVKECPLLTNDQIISPPKIIPPTPSCDGQFVDIEMSKIDNDY